MWNKTEAEKEEGKRIGTKRCNNKEKEVEGTIKTRMWYEEMR